MYAHGRWSWLACLVGAAAAFTAGAVEAEEFSWHLSGGMNRSEVDDLDWDAWSVDATYFLNPVDDSAGPYALASFRDPTTRVSAAASHAEWVSGVSGPTAYELQGTYVLPGQRWYVGASYAKTEVLDNSPFVQRSDPKDYGAFAGRYLSPNTTLGLRLNRSEFSTANVSCLLGPCLPRSTDTTADSIGVEIFHVRRFRSLTYSLQGGVSHTDTDEDVEFFPQVGAPFVLSASHLDSTRVYSVAGELFPTQRLGVRVGYSRLDDDFVDNDSYDVAATWFFNPRIAVQLAIGRTAIDEPTARDVDNTVVRFIGRL